MKYIYRILFLLILLLPITVMASEKTINIHLFYGDGCPHCAKEEEFLEEYLKEHENVKLYKHEVWYSFSNQVLWSNVQEMLKKEATGVPYTVIGNQVLNGFNEAQTKKDIDYIVKYYEKNNYRDLVGELNGTVEKNDDIVLEDKDILSDTTYIPIIGNINPTTVSLSLTAVVIGLVDGFNPCAMWVLLFLITMLINMKDKKKMWVLGLSFLVTSAVIYMMFMVAWLNLAVFVTKITYIRIGIAFIAMVVGLINLKSFLKKNESGCEVVDNKKRKNIIERIKKITQQNKFSIALLGIILLAASVNIIELLCSAGLPLMFTNILALNDLSNLQYAFYIFIYILFFLYIYSSFYWMIL